MKQILAELTTLPKLVDGKVCIVNPDNTRTYLKPSTNTEIKDGFDPLHYAVLKSEKYRECIVYTTHKERADYQARIQHRALLIRRRNAATYNPGDKVHLYTRRGIYTVVGKDQDFMYITCNLWSHEDNPVKAVKLEDVKCLAGGIWNHRRGSV